MPPTLTLWPASACRLTLTLTVSGAGAATTPPGWSCALANGGAVATPPVKSTPAASADPRRPRWRAGIVIFTSDVLFRPLACGVSCRARAGPLLGPVALRPDHRSLRPACRAHRAAIGSPVRPRARRPARQRGLIEQQFESTPHARNAI